MKELNEAFDESIIEVGEKKMIQRKEKKPKKQTEEDKLYVEILKMIDAPNPSLEDLGEGFLHFLKSKKFFQLPVWDRKCTTEDDFIEGFKSVETLLGSVFKGFRVADAPGHQASYLVHPTMCGTMHLEMYAARACLEGIYRVGFSSHIKVTHEISKNLKDVPAGSFKKVQGLIWNFNIRQLLYMVMMIAKDKDMYYEDYLYRIVYKKDEFDQFYSIVNNYEKFKFTDSQLNHEIGSSFREILDVWINIQFPTQLLKKSVRTSDVDLFIICLKKLQKAYARSGHWQYSKIAGDILFDLLFAWKDCWKSLFRSNWLYTTLYGSKIGLDEYYEILNKKNKSGPSTNPVWKQLFRSKFSDITEYVKLIMDGPSHYRCNRVFIEKDPYLYDVKYSKSLFNYHLRRDKVNGRTTGIKSFNEIKDKFNSKLLSNINMNIDGERKKKAKNSKREGEMQFQK